MDISNLKIDFAEPGSMVEKAIVQVLGTVLSKEEAETVTILMIHGSSMKNEVSNWEPRLEVALQKYAPDEPLVLIGLIRPDQAKLGDSPAFQALMARPRVRYVDIVSNFLPGIMHAIDQVRQTKAKP